MRFQKQWMLAAVLAMAAGSARGHFIFVVPNEGGATAKVVMSEDLKTDEEIDFGILGEVKLAMRDEEGKDQPLAVTKSAHSGTVALPGGGGRVVHGTVTFGVRQHGTAKPNLLVYYPKAVVGDVAEVKASGEKVELIPVREGTRVRFKVVVEGKGAAGDEVTVIRPDGEEEKVTTDAAGMTTAFEKAGRYGAWARHVEAVAGEYGGKKYEEIRHYPTLVVEVGGGKTEARSSKSEASSKSEVRNEGKAPKAVAYGKLPQAAASFGAVASEGWMYVYGGHVVKTHAYSTEAVSGRFARMKLDGDGKWEELASGPKIQGMNLAAYEGKVYRVGGMEPRNAPGTEADNYSLDDVSRFDPASGRWEKIATLPEGRSSHDVAIIDGKLYVVGGWTMKGEKEGNTFLKEMLVLDLTSGDGTWQKVEQPFERRALIAAVNGKTLYVIGGFDDNDDPSKRVEVYDTVAKKWSSGPELPGKPMNGFSPAACAVEGRVYVSVADGGMYRMNEKGDGWELVAKGTPRIVHRLVPAGSKILIAGGADRGNNYDLIEAFDTGAEVKLGAARE